jgi:Transcription factor Iwr1
VVGTRTTKRLHLSQLTDQLGGVSLDPSTSSVPTATGGAGPVDDEQSIALFRLVGSFSSKNDIPDTSSERLLRRMDAGSADSNADSSSIEARKAQHKSGLSDHTIRGTHRVRLAQRQRQHRMKQLDKFRLSKGLVLQRTDTADSKRPVWTVDENGSHVIEFETKAAATEPIVDHSFSARSAFYSSSPDLSAKRAAAKAAYMKTVSSKPRPPQQIYQDLAQQFAPTNTASSGTDNTDGDAYIYDMYRVDQEFVEGFGDAKVDGLDVADLRDTVRIAENLLHCGPLVDEEESDDDLGDLDEDSNDEGHYTNDYPEDEVEDPVDDAQLPNAVNEVYEDTSDFITSNPVHWHARADATGVLDHADADVSDAESLDEDPDASRSQAAGFATYDEDFCYTRTRRSERDHDGILYDDLPVEEETYGADDTDSDDPYNVYGRLNRFRSANDNDEDEDEDEDGEEYEFGGDGFRFAEQYFTSIAPDQKRNGTGSDTDASMMTTMPPGSQTGSVAAAAHSQPTSQQILPGPGPGPGPDPVAAGNSLTYN